METPPQALAELENKGMCLPGLDGRACWLTHLALRCPPNHPSGLLLPYWTSWYSLPVPFFQHPPAAYSKRRNLPPWPQCPETANSDFRLPLSSDVIDCPWNWWGTMLQPLQQGHWACYWEQGKSRNHWPQNKGMRDASAVHQCTLWQSFRDTYSSVPTVISTRDNGRSTSMALDSEWSQWLWMSPINIGSEKLG